MEYNLATVVLWINSHSFMQWDFAYLLDQVRALSFSPSACIRHVYQEPISAIGFMANYACSHQTHQWFLGYQNLLIGLTGILHLHALENPHGGR